MLRMSPAYLRNNRIESVASGRNTIVGNQADSAALLIMLSEPND